jgi:mannose-6-phosphate isomerase-like protein (cupin superfamily)
MTGPDNEYGVVHLADRARAAGVGQPLWAASTDLNVNLLVLEGTQEVGRHVNGEVDVLVVGVSGLGLIEVHGHIHEVGAGDALLIPKGAERAIRSAEGHFVYMTCHQRRAGLWPAGVRRPEPPSAP